MKSFWIFLTASLLSVGVMAQSAEVSESELSVELLYSKKKPVSDYYATQGWMFVQDAKLVDGMINYEQIQRIADPETQLSSADFNKDAFNPLDYNIPLQQKRPTYIKVGDQGVIFLYSLNRLEELYNRHVINEKAMQNR